MSAVILKTKGEIKMICSKCGKEITSDATFCSYCGVRLKQSQNNKPTLKFHEFDFSGISKNNSSISEINTWLSSQKIQIHKIKISTYMNCIIPLCWETSLQHLKFGYVDSDKGVKYQMIYFSALGVINFPTKKLEKKFAEWQKNNPDCKILYQENFHHQTTGAERTATKYVLYALP